MAFVGYPLSEVSCPVFPFISTESLLHVIFVCTFILLSLGPSVETSSMHFALGPFSCIDSTVGHLESPFTMKLVRFPLTFVDITIAHHILPESKFQSLSVFSLIWATIFPGLFALAVLFVVFPVTFISLLIFIYKDSVTVCLVVHPLPLIDISISLG